VDNSSTSPPNSEVSAWCGVIVIAPEECSLWPTGNFDNIRTGGYIDDFDRSVCRACSFQMCWIV
jgi:hypothetical protein